ncbi:MAG: hypothetical protein WAW92_01535 [Minisyncoccia bacterium]
MTYWLKIDGALWGDVRNGKGGFESVEELNIVAKQYGYTPLVTDPDLVPQTYLLRVNGIVKGVADLVTMLPVLDISRIPRE